MSIRYKSHNRLEGRFVSASKKQIGFSMDSSAEQGTGRNVLISSGWWQQFCSQD
jgi:hypothetical protein